MRTFVIVFASLLIAGCSSEPAGPTYAEAVATYQAEVALLDSLLSEKANNDVAYQAKINRLIEICGDSLAKEDANRVIRLASSATPETLETTVATVPKQDSVLAAFERGVAKNRRAYNLNSQSIGREITAQRLRVSSAKNARDLLLP